MTCLIRRQNCHSIQMWARRFGRRFAALNTCPLPRKHSHVGHDQPVTHPLYRGDQPPAGARAAALLTVGAREVGS